VAACSQNNEQQEGVCVAQKRYNYSNARKYLFGQLHLKYTKSGLPKVEDVYCNRYITKDDYSKHITRLPGPMKIPDHEVINCEHTWPKSKFSDQERDTQLTDLHHLFPTDTKVNRIRSNYQFGEVDESKGLKGERHEKCQEYFKRGIALQVEGIENTGKTDFFEPPNYHKGNVARALFYMSVRYNNPIGDLEEYYLRKWHVEDPVDEAELKRNHGIYLLQGIRNPFIDYPELVEQISDF
jgi:hypothetical protein